MVISKMQSKVLCGPESLQSDTITVWSFQYNLGFIGTKLYLTILKAYWEQHLISQAGENNLTSYNEKYVIYYGENK
jgi:hypothetical protein